MSQREKGIWGRIEGIPNWGKTRNCLSPRFSCSRRRMLALTRVERLQQRVPAFFSGAIERCQCLLSSTKRVGVLHQEKTTVEADRSKEIHHAPADSLSARRCLVFLFSIGTEKARENGRRGKPRATGRISNFGHVLPLRLWFSGETDETFFSLKMGRRRPPMVLGRTMEEPSQRAVKIGGRPPATLPSSVVYLL